jgi:hypothetical protein
MMRMREVNFQEKTLVTRLDVTNTEESAGVWKENQLGRHKK